MEKEVVVDESDDNLTFICKNSSSVDSSSTSGGESNGAEEDDQEFQQFTNKVLFKFQKCLPSPRREKTSSRSVGENSECEFFDAVSNASSESGNGKAET